MAISKMIKDLDDIWDEYEEEGLLSPETKKALIWHLENDPDPAAAISMTTDMGLKEMAPYLAKHLKNEDDYVRELTIGCLLGRLQLPAYAEIGLKLALEDPEENVRDLAIFAIGEVLNLITDRTLQKKVASLLYGIMTDSHTKRESKEFAYESILAGLGVPILERPSVAEMEHIIFDEDTLEKFKKKFGL